MCEFETATDAPVTYNELEKLTRLIIEDFTLPNAAKIKKELHNLSDEQANTIGLTVEDFINYETKKNSLGKSAFTYLYHINSLLQKLVKKSIINIVPTLGGLPIFGDKYVSLNMPPLEEEWKKITSYAEFLELDYIRDKISPFTAIIVVCDSKGDDHIGSGVLISTNHILTCLHVVDEVTIREVILNGTPYSIKYIYKSETKDVALIEIKDCTLNPEYDVIFSEGHILEPIITFGYPPISRIRETPLIVQKGEINAISTNFSGHKCLIYSSIVRPGNSGGPIFSDKGFFVGMVTEHLERKTFLNTISVDKEMSIDEQIQSLCEQINGIPQIVPFYAGLTAKEIFEEIKLLKPELDISNEW